MKPLDLSDGRHARVALCHEWLTTYGGSEQVASRIARTLDIRDVFTFTAEPDLASTLFPIARIHIVHPIGESSFARRRWQWLLPLMGIAWGRTDLSAYDLVITSSHSSVNAVRVRAGGCHLSYCHTPMRYAWEWRSEMKRLPVFLRPLLPVLAFPLRAMDRGWARHVTAFAANSRYVAARIERYYGRSATVIYPPVDTGYWTPGEERKKEFFLFAGRLVAYKRADLAVEAANKTGLSLVVAGAGPELSRLRKIAGPSVKFIQSPSRDDLRDLYRSARALVVPGVEDFGMTMVEAQSCGTPVVALRQGGAVEAVADGLTGVLYEEANSQGLASVMQAFDPSRYRVDVLRRHVQRFDAAVFDTAIRSFVSNNLRS